MSSSLKHELADHIYQYLCHEAQYSDLPEAAKESLTAASECIEQAYKLNVNNHQQGSGCSGNTSSKTFDGPSGQQQTQSQHQYPLQTRPTDILPDELLRIFTRHKDFLSQQKDSLIYPLRNIDRDEATSTSNEKTDNRINNNTFQANSSSNDHQNNSSNNAASNNNTNTNNMSPTFNNAFNSNNTAASHSAACTSTQQHNQPQSSSTTSTTTKNHSQHPISQLPMTTRKKLSHLRAQIKRQASKAARSRLEKRGSVAGVANSTGGDKSSNCGQFGLSVDGTNLSKHQAGDTHQHHYSKELHNQPNTSSSTESPNAYSCHLASSSPATGVGSSVDANTNLSPTLHESGSGQAGSKLIGQHSLAAPVHHNSNHHHSSIHQKNFKQKIIALLKKFRTDGSDFDSEEQYREALERELMKAAAGRGSRAIEELLEEDIDVEEESESEPEDWDNISESSTPKPSLRPFFSSTTLDKI